MPISATYVPGPRGVLPVSIGGETEKPDRGTLYLIGPSAVGKTTIAQCLARRLDLGHRELDHLLRQRDPSRDLIEVAQDWKIVRPLLEEAERCGEEHVLVDIGAGTQDMDRRHCQQNLEKWLRLRSCRVILIWASPDEVYKRSHHQSRACFDELEYGAARRRIYATASTRIDVGGLALPDAVERACDAILRRGVPPRSSSANRDGSHQQSRSGTVMV